VKTPEQVAEVVCSVLGGGTALRPYTAADVMAPQRGPPRVAYLRAVSMMAWRAQFQFPDDPPSLTETGVAFGRDRRNVARALYRVRNVKLVQNQDWVEIMRRLDG
jgi:hypothetical protein